MQVPVVYYSMNQFTHIQEEIKYVPAGQEREAIVRSRRIPEPERMIIPLLTKREFGR